MTLSVAPVSHTASPGSRIESSTAALMATNLLDSIGLLSRGMDVFTDRLLDGLLPDEARCAELIEGSLAMCTSLVPVIGYDASAAIAKKAHAEGKTVRQVAAEQKVATPEELADLLNPAEMTRPR